MQTGASIVQRIALEGGEEVKQELAEIGRDGERALKQLGDATQRTHSALSQFGDRMQSAVAVFRSFRTEMGTLGERFKAVHEATNKFGESLSQIAERVIPRFREVAALSIPAAAAGFFELTRRSSEAAKALDETAKSLGLTVEQLQDLHQAGLNAGIATDEFDRGLAHLTQVVGQARLEYAKATGDLDQNGIVLRGHTELMGKAAAGMKQAQGNAIVLRGSVAGMRDAFSGSAQVLRGAGQEVVDLSNAIATLKIDVTQFPKTAQGNLDMYKEMALRLQNWGDAQERARIAQELFGRSWYQQLPLWASLGANLAKAREQLKGFYQTEEETAQAVGFQDHLRTMQTAVTRTTQILSNSLGRLLVPLFDAVSDALSANIEHWRAWSNQIVEQFLPKIQTGVNQISQWIQGKLARQDIQTPWAKRVVDGLTLVANAARGAAGAFEFFFTVLQRIVDPFVRLANLLGADLDTKTTALGVAIFYLAGGFKALELAIKLVWAAGNLLFTTNPMGLAIRAAIIAITLLIAYWPEVKKAITDFGLWIKSLEPIWQNFKQWMSQFVESIAKAINDTFTWLADAVKSTLKWISDAVDWVLRKLHIARQQAAPVTGETPTPGAAAAPSPFATGGAIDGPRGTDTVPIWATAGEFMMRLSAVRHYGLDFMQRLNSMQLPRFAAGGLVPSLGISAPTRYFADGGRVQRPYQLAGFPGQVAFSIIFGDERHNAATDAATATRLARYARGAAMRSAGRKPSWNG